MASTAPAITIRPPTFSPAKGSADFQTPSVAWLTEKWHVTHSTLPMWKDKRNVTITYNPLPHSDPSAANAQESDRIEDVVSYQALEKTKVSTIKGVDTAASAASRGEWNWRGAGLLKLITSHWEVIGWGVEEDDSNRVAAGIGAEEAGKREEGKGANKWVVTVFEKTLFTPAGIDVYSRDRAGVRASTLEQIKQALAAVEDDEVKKMAATIFAVTVNDPEKTTKEQ